ncbi:FAD-dependent monooxygenase [Comamonas flocculans]|uniref:2-polyprenyl-6-methoxyphenol hydroxylase n=1 Tax=Comamonas flocculans TaxID=2597701 RepID=A0A5B8RXT9_9BURK|nr:FAD-dependent monooxygenase [Comamonas flocculans]QEA13452.1 2-polyprenyl-6-methoxyphenol hydroxylase [Comamonas flocculans]
MLSQDTRIAIVGGGLAGLTAAVALQKIAGVRATVFEQSNKHDEVGAGVTVAPNGSRMLDKLGLFEPIRDAGATPDGHGVYLDALGNVVTDAAWEDSAKKYQNVGIFRPDLIDILAGAVDPDMIRLHHRASSVELLDKGVRVHFTNGEQEDFDAVIGADGIRSVVRAAVGQQTGFVYSGFIAYRGVIDAADLPRDWNRISQTWMGNDRHLMTYPLQQHKLYNYVACVPSSRPLHGPWSGPAQVSEVHAEFERQKWDPRVHEFLSHIKETFWWGLFDIEPLTNWSRGPIALLGDAAHSMIPHQGQGVNQAFEDCLTLAYFLKEADSVSDIALAFRRYTAVRMQRATILQVGSRRAGWMFDSQFQFTDTEKRDVDITSGRDFRRAAVFDYDALKVAEMALKRFKKL